MILIANLLGAIASVLNIVLSLIEIILVLSAVFSWFPACRNNPSCRMVNDAAEYILRPVRKYIHIRSGIDFAYIIAFIIIIFIQAFIISSLFDYAHLLKVSARF